MGKSESDREIAATEICKKDGQAEWFDDEDWEVASRLVAAGRAAERREWLPKANGLDKIGGWELDPSLLKDVVGRVDKRLADPDMETVEAVLLAFARLKGSPDADN